MDELIKETERGLDVECTGSWKDPCTETTARRKFEIEEAKHRVKLKHIYMLSSHGTMFLMIVVLLALGFFFYGLNTNEDLLTIAGAVSAVLFGGGTGALTYKYKSKTWAGSTQEKFAPPVENQADNTDV